jgi:hypothetical protein
MAKKQKQEGEVNKSQAIRDLLKENPKIKANAAVAALAEQGIAIKASLFYIVKGKALGRKGRRRRNQRKAVEMVASASGKSGATGHNDAVATIRKVKAMAADVGGLQMLKDLVNALTE